MAKKRRQHSKEFKFKIALEAVKGVKTISQLAAQYNVHPTQISTWKKQLLLQGSTLFVRPNDRQRREQQEQEAALYEQIGRLKMELEWLKKKLPPLIELKREILDVGHPGLSIRRQCELMGLNRSSYYYQPAIESPLNLTLMRLIDEQYLRTPFYGYLKMTEYLRQTKEYQVNPKRVYRLMQLMGLRAVFARPRTSQPAKEHKIYPYLLRGVDITRPNQVWSADITYVPMQRGFMYLVAVLDWYSRYVLSWGLSNTLEGDFCLTALEQALQQGKPETFNTDQGAQFTANAFTGRLEQDHIKVSMDGKGRVFDNIFNERLWRTVKYEDIYLNEYETGLQLVTGLAGYFDFYNHDRFHQRLGYLTPAQVYGQSRATWFNNPS